MAANEAASCRFMKMVTLPKLRDALREMAPVVKVPDAIAERARLPIERMVAIGSGAQLDPALGGFPHREEPLAAALGSAAV